MAKITTEDCVQAIVEYFSNQLGPAVFKDSKNWKRESKTGNSQDGYKRIFRNTMIKTMKVVVLSTATEIKSVECVESESKKEDELEKFKEELKEVEDAEKSTENPDVIPQEVKDYFAEKDKGKAKTVTVEAGKSEYIWGGFGKCDGEYSVCITPRKYFEDTGFMDDKHLEIDGLEQAGYFELMEGTFETPYATKDENKEALAKLGIEFDEKFNKFLKKH